VDFDGLFAEGFFKVFVGDVFWHAEDFVVICRIDDGLADGDLFWSELFWGCGWRSSRLLWLFL
jgi:hypothetical protein